MPSRLAADPSLVIEVVNPQSRTHDVRIAQLQRLFENRDDWRLEVVYAPEATEGVRPVAVDDIDATLARAARLSESDPQVALLLAWAALEAGAERLLHPDETRRGLPSGSLLDLLGSLGDTTRDEQATLHRIAEFRETLSRTGNSMPPSLARTSPRCSKSPAAYVGGARDAVGFAAPAPSGDGGGDAVGGVVPEAVAR